MIHWSVCPGGERSQLQTLCTYNDCDKLHTRHVLQHECVYPCVSLAPESRIVRVGAYFADLNRPRAEGGQDQPLAEEVAALVLQNLRHSSTRGRCASIRIREGGHQLESFTFSMASLRLLRLLGQEKGGVALLSVARPCHWRNVAKRHPCRHMVAGKQSRRATGMF